MCTVLFLDERLRKDKSGAHRSTSFFLGSVSVLRLHISYTIDASGHPVFLVSQAAFSPSNRTMRPCASLGLLGYERHRRQLAELREESRQMRILVCHKLWENLHRMTISECPSHSQSFSITLSVSFSCYGRQSSTCADLDVIIFD